ncbi:MAG: ribonuclease T2 [Alphaproteobacteria bacterium]|nr:ribonuclease T2 [Alphaproteobacteria bacterium]
MKFDRNRLLQIGAAVVVAVIAAVFGFGGGGSSEAPAPVTLNDPAPAVSVAEAPALTPSKPAPVAVPESTGDFDYYLLVLSWSPTHCSSDAGRGRDDDLQCRSGRPYGFVLHGLWPQYERGWPERCSTEEPRSVTDANMTATLKLSPSRQLVQHEWEKHGTCAGLSQDDYFAAAALAVESVKVPKAYRSPAQPLVTTPNAVRRAFLDANSGIPDDGLSATCGRNQLAEVWVCLDKNLAPRSCSAEVRKKHCGAREVRMLSVRGDWPR